MSEMRQLSELAERLLCSRLAHDAHFTRHEIAVDNFKTYISAQQNNPAALVLVATD